MPKNQLFRIKTEHTGLLHDWISDNYLYNLRQRNLIFDFFWDLPEFSLDFLKQPESAISIFWFVFFGIWKFKKPEFVFK